MELSSEQKDAEIAGLLEEIQGYMNILLEDTAGMVHMFFDSKMTIPEISYVFQLSETEVEGVIKDFLAGLITSCSAVERFLSRLFQGREKPGKLWTSSSCALAYPQEMAEKLFAECERPNSAGRWLSEVVGFALIIQASSTPQWLHEQIFSNLSAMLKGQ